MHFLLIPCPLLGVENTYLAIQICHITISPSINSTFSSKLYEVLRDNELDSDTALILGPGVGKHGPMMAGSRYLDDKESTFRGIMSKYYFCTEEFYKS